jgi:hypothetical protein
MLNAFANRKPARYPRGMGYYSLKLSNTTHDFALLPLYLQGAGRVSNTTEFLGSSILPINAILNEARRFAESVEVKCFRPLVYERECREKLGYFAPPPEV